MNFLHLLLPTEWFDIDENHNSRIYISGLPSDITMEEFKELVSKCGIVMEDDDGESVACVCVGEDWYNSGSYNVCRRAKVETLS